ncbi:rhomboid family intramembrane serine protease [Nocardioides marinquilinus]|uniref:Rhomboid family intramembrane serine protease n=1 Tax=Nocardioides marinquilinus TaxID=1210400 RepID=A0ABP9P510_9ACTN
MSESPAAGVSVCYRHPGREANIRCQRCSRPICPDCMRDAAVGFQCPTCVSEGARTTRQAQAPYGGARSANPALTSFVLIGMNLAVYVAVLFTGWRTSPLVSPLGLWGTGACESKADPGSFYYYGGRSGPCEFPDGRWIPGVSDGGYWELITNAFLHVEIWHIAANMLSLFVLGPQVEAVLGRTRFLAVYLLSALSGSTVVYWFSGPGDFTLGASGAIFGLFGALAVIVYKVGGDMRAVLGLLAVNAVITFTIPNISWQGHLGGLVGGALVTAVLVYAPRGPRRSTVQWLALLGLLGVIALAVIARSAALA